MSEICNRNNYIALYLANNYEPQLCRILNEHGGCNMTVCPECHVDDFCHIEGCPIGIAIDKLERIADDV